MKKISVRHQSKRQRTTNTILRLFQLWSIPLTQQYLIKKLSHEHGITTYKRASPHLSFISKKRVLVKGSESSYAPPFFITHPISTPDCLFNLILPLSLTLYATLLRPLFIVLLLHPTPFSLFFPLFSLWVVRILASDPP